MKKNFFLAVALLVISVCASAQIVDNRLLSYSVTYEKEHLFLQKDSGFNVVDYDIEWPEAIDFDRAIPLKHCISKFLLDFETASLDSLLNGFYDTYGKPVSGPLKTIPDDNRFCYVTSTARIAGYQRGHWIAYYIENKIEPQKLSVYPAFHVSRVVVYDISRDKLFPANELISAYVVQRSEPQEFYDVLFSPLPDDFYNNMQSCEIDGVWTEGTDLCFLVTAKTDEMKTQYTSRMPLDYFAYTLSREGKKIFTKDVKAKQPQKIIAPLTWHGDSIYNNVEKMPEFKGGQEGMKQYLSHVTKPGIELNGSTRVYTDFIIDKDGNVKDVNVLSPVNPIIDRHAAFIIKGMPQFTPGEHNGKKVCVRMYMPITYR